MKKVDILTFGSITLDSFIRPEEVEFSRKNNEDVFSYGVGQKIKIKTLAKHVGGGSANSAVGFAKLGLKTICAGTIGTDTNAEFILHCLNTEKVDTTKISRKKGSSSYSIIFMFPDGRRTVFNEKVHTKSCEIILDKDIETKAVYCGHLSENEESFFQDIVSWKKRNKTNFFAWNPGKTQFEKGIENFREILAQTNILILNKEEAQLFLGNEDELNEIPINKANVEILWKNKIEKIFDCREIASEFLSRGVRTLIITDGKNGAQLFDIHGSHFFAPPVEYNTPVCTLGAGDSFSVGVVSALLYEKNSAEAMRWGAENSNSVIKIFGAQKGLLNKTEIENLVE